MKQVIFILLLVSPLLSHPGLDYWAKVKDDIRHFSTGIPKRFADTGELYLDVINKDSQFHEYNIKVREKILETGKNQNFLGRPIESDSPELFFGDSNYAKTLSQIPTSGHVAERPWSSTYWPIYLGVLSIRYEPNEKNTIFDAETKKKYNYIESIKKYQEPVDYLAASANVTDFEEYIAQYFSASEKYDLLIGDVESFTLTNQNKLQGMPYWKREGDVAGWMGICHGWAPAAFSVPRPQGDVTVLAADGKTKIKFYADDIRGLASLKWASTRHRSVFVGGRCNLEDKDVPKDPESGLVTDYTCFDVNPATWHLVVGNRMGLQKESFVIDATFDYQVWNQPVYKYNLTYFNLINQTIQGNIAESKIPVENLRGLNDSYFKFMIDRFNPNTKSIIGVVMDLDFVAETNPSHKSPGKDREVLATYVYSLELDENDNIIGGEWLVPQHPDFIWAPAPGVKPINKEDEAIDSLNLGALSAPENLRQLKEYGASASKRGEVLGAVVDYLTQESSKTRYVEPIEVPVVNNTANATNTRLVVSESLIERALGYFRSFLRYLN